MNFKMPRPAPKTNFFTIFFHTIILLILLNKMTPCALLRNSFQKLKQRRSEKSSLFLIGSKYTYILHANMYICSKYTYICMQICIFVLNIRIFACKNVYLHAKTYICMHICLEQRRSKRSSLFK